eukprot:2665023-Prymnesium_polylepis.1
MSGTTVPNDKGVNAHVDHADAQRRHLQRRKALTADVRHRPSTALCGRAANFEVLKLCTRGP